MVDPSKLVNSSKRVFGDLDEWYGEVLPIEQDRIMPVKGGEIGVFLSDSGRLIPTLLLRNSIRIYTWRRLKVLRILI